MLHYRFKNLKMKKISILIPCYNEEASLPLLYNELVKLMDSHTNYAWEVLTVNDGSKDRTLEVIKDLRKKIIESVMLIFLEILEKRKLCLRDLIM